MAVKYYFGAFLVLVILSSSVYFLLPGEVRIDIENTRTKYYVYEDGFVLAATEYLNLYDGTTKMRAKSRDVSWFNDSQFVYAVRVSKWKENITTIQTYKFNQNVNDVRDFPSENTLECYNCQGKIVHYEIRDIGYDGETTFITSPFSFGHNMKIEWSGDYYYAKVFQQKVTDKIIIKYRPKESYEVYNVRLFDPPPEIGYEFLDNNSVVKIWNTQYDYYFEKDSGIQLTNHYEDYWTKNIFCIGYYNNDEWNKIKCSDELTGFNKEIITDNQTYINATLWKDITFGLYDLRLGVGYHLGLNDENLSITIYGKNLGIDIPFDLGFAWKVTDWDIPGEADDYMIINNTGYLIKGTYDLIFKDMEESYFKGRDSTYDFGGEFLRVNWNENLDYSVKMYGNGIQEDFYVALLINAGRFDSGQEKQTTFQWIDAIVIGVNAGFVTVAPTTDPDGGANAGIADKSLGFKVTSPSESVKITEIGFYRALDANENFEIGLYSHDSGGDKPDNRLFVDDTNTNPGAAGWAVVTGLDWTISPSTIYWLAVQADVGTIKVSNTGEAQLVDRKDSSFSLSDPWGTTDTNFDRLAAIYALVESVGNTCTYPGSGNWNITCSDNCFINQTQIIDGNLSLTGSGLVILNSTLNFNFTGWEIFIETNCKLFIDTNEGGKII